MGGNVFGVDSSLIKLDASRYTKVEAADWSPSEQATRAVREYVDTLHDAAFGVATEVTPKFVSHADPSSQWTAAHHGPAYFAYSNNYLMDTDNAVIVDVQASRSVRTGETHAPPA